MTTELSTRQWLILNDVGGLTVEKVLALTEQYGDVLALTACQLRDVGWTERQVTRRFKESPKIAQQSEQWLRESPKHHIVSFHSTDYPTLLKQIDTPPMILFIWGDPTIIEQPQLAVVGSRKATLYGKKVTSVIVSALVTQGIAITSGLAAGVDGVAHDTALGCGGTTIAVLGSGLANIYPKQHVRLARRITENGGAVLSEFPLHAPPLKQHFPRRNRIISGLSLGTIVSEANVKSGSLITARFALEQNREVFAIPGNILSGSNAGCHNLLKQGATLVESVEDILSHYKMNLIAPNCSKKIQTIKNLSKNQHCEDKVLYSIEHEVTALDLIAARTKLQVECLLPLLIEYELTGKIISVPGGYIKVEE